MSDVKYELATARRAPALQFVAAAGPRVNRRRHPDSGYALASDWKAMDAPRQSGLRYTWQDGLPVLPESTLGREAQLVVKRALDIVLSLFGLLLLSPILLGAIIAIKATSEGPIFFRQSRTGLNGKAFRIYKFRSMYVDRGDDTGRAQTRENDDRITPVGRVLRKKSIDELPQLLNVLFGHMSLVGPRPHVPGMLAGGVTYETLVPYYDLRNAMRPGITGWAQANGLRGPTTDAVAATARIDHDIAYVQNYSLLLDAHALLLTVWRELTRGTGL